VENSDLDTLMARLADGDRAAFDPVFRALWAPTVRLCSSILKNEADAHDAAQQAMEKILARASDYDGRRPAMPWALALAGWECRTMMRRRSRRREVGEETAPEPASSATEGDLVQRNLVRAAVDAMGHLSPLDQETLMATFLGLSGGVPAATFRKRRERATEKLREAFRRLYGFD
jgi:RNA polymerase sigma-70 factor (ECF subfamily)